MIYTNRVPHPKVFTYEGGTNAEKIMNLHRPVTESYD
jgi:hypothetical protein